MINNKIDCTINNSNIQKGKTKTTSKKMFSGKTNLLLLVIIEYENNKSRYNGKRLNIIKNIMLNNFNFLKDTFPNTLFNELLTFFKK